MGLFRSDVLYTAYSGSVRLIDPDDPSRDPKQEYPNTMLDAVLQAVYDQGNIAQYVTIASQLGLATDARRMVSYAIDEYIYGLPTGTYIGSNANFDAVENYIVDNLTGGAPIDRTFSGFGPMGIDFYTRASMKRTYLDPAFFAWGAPPDTGAFSTWDESMTSIQVPVIDASTSDYWSINNNPILHPFGTSYSGDPQMYLRVFEGIVGFGLVEWETPHIPSSDAVNYPNRIRDIVNLKRPHYQVAYKVPTGANPDETFYFYYDVESHAIPELDISYDPTSISNYMPIAVLVRDQVHFNADPDSELAKTTRELLSKINMDADETLATFMEEVAEGQTDGDIAGDPWDVFIHFGVPININEKYSKQYLFKFFKQLEAFGTFDENDYNLFLTEWGSGDAIAQQYNTFEMTEASEAAGADLGYRVDFRWSYVDSVVQDIPTSVSGLKKGESTMDCAVIRETDPATITKYRSLLELMYPGFGSTMPIGEDIPGYHDIVLMTMQISATQVERLLIMALDMRYTINTSADPLYQFREAFPGLIGQNTAGEWTLNAGKQFLIPVSLGLLRELPPFKRERVIAAALHATCFFVVETEIPWYQTAPWRGLILIVTIFLVIYSGQVELFEIALGTAGVGAAVTYLAMFAQFALGYLISLSAEIIGGRLGILFAVVAIFYVAGGIDGFKKTMLDIWANVGTTTLMSAINFINAVGPLLQAGFTMYQERAMGKLEDEMESWTKTADEKFQELQDAWASLELTDVKLNPLSIVRKNFYNIESANDFFSRTLNQNPGIGALNYPKDFHEIALRLPKGVNDVNIVDLTMQQMKAMTTNRRFA